MTLETTVDIKKKYTCYQDYPIWNTSGFFVGIVNDTNMWKFDSVRAQEVHHRNNIVHLVCELNKLHFPFSSRVPDRLPI